MMDTFHKCGRLPMPHFPVNGNLLERLKGTWIEWLASAKGDSWDPLLAMAVAFLDTTDVQA